MLKGKKFDAFTLFLPFRTYNTDNQLITDTSSKYNIRDTML